MIIFDIFKDTPFRFIMSPPKKVTERDAGMSWKDTNENQILALKFSSPRSSISPLTDYHMETMPVKRVNL